MIPLLIMPLNQPLPIQVQRDLRINRLLHPLLFQRNRALEHVMLGEIEGEFAIGAFGEEGAGCGGGGGEEFGHAVELGADAVEAGGYADGVVEGGGGGVVGVGGFGGVELVDLGGGCQLSSV